MKTIIKPLLITLLAIMSANSTLAVINPDTIKTLLENKQVQDFVVELNKLKAQSDDSIADNFVNSGKGIASGFHGLGLGLSRMIYNGSRNFQEAGTALANHYWVLGGLIAGSAAFYFYVLPKLRINISYSTDDNNHHPVRRP